jgi:hypothetical protein
MNIRRSAAGWIGLVFTLPLHAADPPPNVSLRLESFSLSLTDAARLLREDAADPSLYQTCVSGVTDGRSKQELLTVIRGRAGWKSVSRSVLETIYPTEYEPPELPTHVPTNVPTTRSSPPASLFELLVSSPPTSFETRSLGFEFEAAPELTESPATIDLIFSAERVHQPGITTHGRGIHAVTMPEFETQKLQSTVRLTLGRPTLIGTFSPTPESKSDAPPRVWFSFVTASFIEP